MAERALVADSFSQVKHAGDWACDVIVPIPSVDGIGMDLAAITHSVQAILEQEGVISFVHLVGGSDVQEIADSINLPRQVFVYQTNEPASRGWRMHLVLENLKTELIAWHDVCQKMTPLRIRNACNALWLSGADLSLSPVKRGNVEIELSKEDFCPSPSSNAFDAIGSLLCRRATIVDLDGLSDTEDALVDFVRRAIDQEYLVHFDAGASELTNRRPVGEHSPLAAKLPGSEGAHAKPLGFRQFKVECDLVLPFFNHLDYAQQAMEGALSQENADVTIHLIDDASTENTNDFMRQWRGHSQVRCYRNRQNIGQFMSLNNAVQYCDTELIAVQDADDVSMPHRITTGGNLLRLCDADFFGGAVQLFGDNNLIRPIHVKTDELEVIERTDKRYSFFPPASSIPYFLENPTAMFRRDMFRQRGGYADFGTREMNRASLDSEFLLRCFFSGVRFAITRRAVTHYRVHEQSATQNRVTGWGTDARAQSSQIVYENTLRFRNGPFDPRVFGSLGKYQEVTEPIG